MIFLESLSKSFGSVKAVDGLDLEIPAGQMVGIIGRSGAGKSTLLRLMNRLIDPTAGRIAFDGVDETALKGAALRAWRARCAMIFQQFNLVNRLDVITNVLIGRIGYRATLPTLLMRFSEAERAKAILALDRLEMADFAMQRAERLSGGQQQRVAIARALMQEPDILLADEPIASLDPANAKKVMDALRAINREDGITVVVNLHHLETARDYCDRIVGMADGRVVFDGPVAALTADEVRAIYGLEQAETELETIEAGIDLPPAKPFAEPVAASVA